jgi:hypothetical protein
MQPVFDIRKHQDYGMYIVGQNMNYAFTRDEHITHVDQWALTTLTAIDPDCLQTYLKDYSRSYYDADFHLNALLQYNRKDPDPKLFDEAIVHAVKDHIRNELRVSNVRVSSKDVLTELDSVRYESSSAAGYGFQGKKGPFKDKETQNNHWKAIRIAKKMALDYYDSKGESLAKQISDSTPYIGYTRTQLTNLNEKLKVRAVWGAPFQHILLEGLSAQPFIDSVSMADCFLHLGQDPLESVPRLIHEVTHGCTWSYTFDWSSFDATTSRYEIDLAFDLIEECIDFPNAQSQAAFDLARNLFNYKKVVGPNGIIYAVNTGVPSGSNWTNIIDGIVNAFRIMYLWMKLTGKLPKMAWFHGDDSLCGSDEYVSVIQLSEEAKKYGWILNVDKSIVTRDQSALEFLGRTTSGGFSIRSIDKCLRLLVYPEYPVEDPRISSYRAESIFDDVGRSSTRIAQVAASLKRRYGIASDYEVPKHHKRYKF